MTKRSNRVGRARRVSARITEVIAFGSEERRAAMPVSFNIYTDRSVKARYADGSTREFETPGALSLAHSYDFLVRGRTAWEC